MNIETIADKIEIIGTILGTILFTCYVMYKTFTSKLEKWQKESKANISGRVTRQSKLDCEIIQEAEKLKEIINADRIQVYEFHNGVHYANGRSALKTSCTYEVCRYGMKSHINELSNIPFSVIPNFIKSLLDKKELEIKDIKDIKINMPSSYNLLNRMKVKSCYCFDIHNEKGEPVGFVLVQYCDNNIKDMEKDMVKRFVWFVESKLSEM